MVGKAIVSKKLHVSRKELSAGYRRLRHESQPSLERAVQPPAPPARVKAPVLLHALYALECGLKLWLLQARRISTTQELEDADLTHDLNRLLELLKQRPELKAKWKAESPPDLVVPAAQLHELYRYGGRLADADERELAKRVLDLFTTIEGNATL